MFEVLEHTADIGFRARARTLPELFETSAEALVSIALELDTVMARESYPFEAMGEDNESLLVNWLSEVLWLLDGRKLALRRFRVTAIESGRAIGHARGEPCDPQRHRARVIVKGVTYHQLKIVRDDAGWCAEVFLDI